MKRPLLQRRLSPPVPDRLEYDVDQLNILLVEYQTLRDEIIQSLSNRVAVMNFTFGSLSVVMAGIAVANVSQLARGLVALLFVPQMAKAGLLIWLGEYSRCQRAGRWLHAHEAKINRLLDHQVLAWEQGLANLGAHMSYPYKATISYILGIGYLGVGMGGYFLYSHYHGSISSTPGALSAAVALALGILIYETLFLRFVLRRWVEIRTGASL